MLKKNNFFIHEKIQPKKIYYGFFTRQGGFSKKKLNSLNFKLIIGENKNNIKKNINIAKTNIGLKNHKIKFINQIHSNKVSIITKKNFRSKTTADASISFDNDIALAVLTADCAPIFLFDNKYNMICAIHVGWKGCLNNIIENTINKISKKNIYKKNLIAIIGPCLDKKSFEVDNKFKSNFIKKKKLYDNFFKINYSTKKIFFDMRALINFQLKKSSIGKIYNIKIDTYSNKNLFYSHRLATHDNVATGRMINIIGFA